MINCNEEKHDIEEQKSWKFHEQRVRDDEKSLNRRLKKHSKKHSKKKGPRIPEPDSDTFHAMMIDAGSQGTRLHIYEFPERLLFHRKDIIHALNGYKLSLPTTNSRWTNRLKPGLDSLAFIKDDGDLERAMENYLTPLLNFVRSVLSDKADDWDRYPIYLKATGGLRTLPTQDRVRLITMVRKVFNNATFNPFQFQDERARVISGEEEAIYGWTAVNFIKGTLIHDSEGVGDVLAPNLT
jgi:Golgi nucleoside diphosphatase